MLLLCMMIHSELTNKASLRYYTPINSHLPSKDIKYLMVEMFMIIDNFYRLIISLLGECQYECCPFGGRCALQGDAASRKAHDLTGDG